jgi:hypothetical protein
MLTEFGIAEILKINIKPFVSHSGNLSIVC